MQLSNNEIHIWFADLSAVNITDALSLLSVDERERAFRFRFPIHRERYIAARYALRRILGSYLSLPPADIIFSYGEHQKPSIANPNKEKWHFNMAHSDEIAVYAIAKNASVGIDIEKTGIIDKKGVAERFFSADENKILSALSLADKNSAFYRLWVRKEALLKAVGTGLTLPLSHFTVSAFADNEYISLRGADWTLMSIALHPDYEAAIASSQAIKKIVIWDYFKHLPIS